MIPVENFLKQVGIAPTYKFESIMKHKGVLVMQGDRSNTQIVLRWLNALKKYNKSWFRDVMMVWSWKGTVYVYFRSEPPQWVKDELDKIEIPYGGEISTKEYLGV